MFDMAINVRPSEDDLGRLTATFVDEGSWSLILRAALVVATTLSNNIRRTAAIMK